MKKALSTLLSITFLIGLIFNNNLVYASYREILNDKSNTTKGYWSEANAPEFYGTTKIVLKKGDVFSLKDARYRIFARDFEDFDLTQNIVAKHNVDTQNVGEYEINYSVTDSHGNTTTIDVPVTVTDKTDVKPMIERTMYTLADIDNVKKMEIERGHNNDRQMLGLFIRANSNVQIRKTAGSSNLSYTMLNNDSHKEATKTITSEWQEITFEHDYTPFIKTLYKHKGPVKVEIQWDSEDTGVKELNYYHEGDDEEAFFEKWRKDINTYSVVESYILTVLVPYTDINEISGHYQKGFDSLDAFFEYYRKVVEAYDKTLGLDYAPDNPYDQNVNARFFIKANVHGVGAAYYATDHIGVNKAKVSSFFEANWGGLHEVGHGYQGSLGKGDLQIGEVSNNVFAYYVQTNRNIFPYDASWLGKLPNIEEKHNKVRLEGGTFLDLEIPGKLYFVINFLNAFEGPETYAHIAKLYRKNVIEGKQMSTEDAWALGIYDKYGISLVDYFEAWGINVSEEARIKIEQGNSKNMFSLKDLVLEQNLVDKIKSDLNLECNYSLVTNEQLSSYNIKGSSKINIEIDNIDLLKGKYIQLKDGKKVVAKVKIDSNIIEIPDVPVGVYKLVVPELVGDYTNNAKSILICNGKETKFNLVYENINTGNNFENDVKVQFQGYYYNDAAEIKLVNDNSNLKLNLRYRGTTLFNSGLAQDTEYAKIQVLDTDDKEVYKKVVKGKGDKFSTQNYETVEVKVGIGYKLVLKYGNSDTKLKFISNLNNDYRTKYEIPKNQDRTFIITEDGLKPESMSEEEFYTEYTDRMKKYIDNFISTVTEDEIYNKYFYRDIKAIIINGYKKMNKVDKQLYEDTYNKIVNGHSPVITSLNETIEVKINENIDLTKLVEVSDVEDGKIEISHSNIETNLDTKKLGTYTVTYTVTDSDSNISTKTITIKVIKHDYDSSELEKLIKEVEMLDESKYEEKSFENLQQALGISKETLLRDDVTQDIVNEQIIILRKCLNDLKRIYKVTFNNDDESEIINVIENSNIEKPEELTKDGYTFEGWYKDENCTTKWNFETDVVNGDITLYAKWTKIPEYTVRFESNDGSEVNQITNVREGTTIAVPSEPTRDGYIFGGWYREKEFTTKWNFETDVVNENITLYAKWTKIPEYTVSFESNDGSEVNQITNVREGTTIAAPSEPTRDGYIFGGWYKDEKLQEAWDFATNVVNGDITLYAKWTKIPEYTVSFESNDGSEVNPITNVREGTTIAVPSEPTRDGYTFEGWYKDEKCTVKWDFEADIVNENIRLYAKWKKVLEEPIEPPVDDGEIEEPIEPPVDDGEIEEPIEPPVDDGEIEEPIEPPVDDGEIEEPIEPPVDDGEVEEPVKPPVDDGEVEEPVKPPVDDGEIEEPIEPPVDDGEIEEPIEPPIDDGEIEEPVKPPVDDGKAEEPIEPPVDDEKVEKPIESSANEKITEEVINSLENSEEAEEVTQDQVEKDRLELEDYNENEESNYNNFKSEDIYIEAIDENKKSKEIAIGLAVIATTIVGFSKFSLIGFLNKIKLAIFKYIF